MFFSFKTLCNCCEEPSLKYPSLYVNSELLIDALGHQTITNPPEMSPYRLHFLVNTDVSKELQSQS